MKYYSKRLIIWRSLVQAQAGPRKVKALIAQNQAFNAFLFCSLFDFCLALSVSNQQNYTLFSAFVYRLFIAKQNCNMLTINAEVKKNGLRSDGTYNVKLRFTLDRKMRRISTSLFVTSKDLTKEFKIRQNSPIKQEIDSLIRSYQERCAKLQVELN